MMDEKFLEIEASCESNERSAVLVTSTWRVKPGLGVQGPHNESGAGGGGLESISLYTCR